MIKKKSFQTFQKRKILITLLTLIFSYLLLINQTNALLFDLLENYKPNNHETSVFITLVSILFPQMDIIISNLNVTGILTATETHFTNTTVTDVNVTDDLIVNGDLTVIGNTYNYDDVYTDSSIIPTTPLPIQFPLSNLGNSTNLFYQGFLYNLIGNSGFLYRYNHSILGTVNPSFWLSNLQYGEPYGTGNEIAIFQPYIMTYYLTDNNALDLTDGRWSFGRNLADPYNLYLRGTNNLGSVTDETFIIENADMRLTGDFNIIGTGTLQRLLVDSPTLVVNNAGHSDEVGIGISSPSARLDVRGINAVSDETDAPLSVYMLGGTGGDTTEGNGGKGGNIEFHGGTGGEVIDDGEGTSGDGGDVYLTGGSYGDEGDYGESGNNGNVYIDGYRLTYGTQTPDSTYKHLITGGTGEVLKIRSTMSDVPRYINIYFDTVQNDGLMSYSGTSDIFDFDANEFRTTNRFGINGRGVYFGSSLISEMELTTGFRGIEIIQDDAGYNLPIRFTTSINSGLLTWDNSGNFFDFNNSVNVNGNITSENVFIKSYISVHTNNTIPVTSSGVWQNVTFDNEESEIKQRITHNHSGEYNYTFTIEDDGIYEITYTMSFEDSAIVPNSHIVTRVLRNGTELNGFTIEEDLGIQNQETSLHHSDLIDLYEDDELILQFTSDDTTVSLSSHLTYGVHKNTGHLTIKRVA